MFSIHFRHVKLFETLQVSAATDESLPKSRTSDDSSRILKQKSGI
jgi:hypothetical protein